jgi:mannose-6-phosphate isomerase-like protein (cupin superfamily)
MYEIYQLPQGKIVLSAIKKNLSTGVLYLNPRQKLQKHNRPVMEQLVQIAGTCVMKIFDGDNLVEEVTLQENDTLTIPANQFHIHSNLTDQISVTMWKFEGDILEVIQKIREENKKVL